MAAGILAALFAIDLALYPFVASYAWPKTPVRTIRAYVEGIAESHFVPDDFGTYGRRLTGNDPVSGAPSIVILGDSHVVQDSVPDRDTLGAVIERLSRAAGRPVNVLQYGWYSAAAPTYIGEGPGILARFHPAKVVAFMNFTDISTEIFNGDYWRMRVKQDGSYSLIDIRPPKADPNKFNVRDLAGVSRLVIAARRRAIRIVEAAGPKSQTPQKAVDLGPAVRASVKGLKDAYGDRILVVYAPVCSPRCAEQPPEQGEQLLLRECGAQKVQCVSVRPEMIDELRTHQRLTRGYHNTQPGVGHLNETGLRLSGEVIWREISKELGR